MDKNKISRFIARLIKTNYKFIYDKDEVDYSNKNLRTEAFEQILKTMIKYPDVKINTGNLSPLHWFECIFLKTI